MQGFTAWLNFTAVLTRHKLVDTLLLGLPPDGLTYSQRAMEKLGGHGSVGLLQEQEGLSYISFE